MWAASYWPGPRAYWAASYWPKVGESGFVPPPPSAGGHSCYLPILGIGCWLLMIFSGLAQ